jgi:diadenosine tetraphosphate (Ap4A) HIT family hydrolase
VGQKTNPTQGTSSVFEIDPRLMQDSLFVTDLKLSRLLLKNDQRFLWLILVPRKPNISEIIELNLAEQQILLNEINLLSKLLKENYKADKLNIANLGNIVPQLHIHVIARYHNDCAWPSPVWGFQEPLPFSAPESELLIKKLMQQVAATPFT